MSLLRTKNGEPDAIKITIFSIVCTVLFVILLMFSLPKYSVWSKGMKGRAELARAEQNKQILIAEASARLEAEKLNALAEVERAKGMAAAIEIEQGQLTSVYNQYLFIRTLENIAKEGTIPTIIYVPSQGLIPVLDLTHEGKVNK